MRRRPRPNLRRRQRQRQKKRPRQTKRQYHIYFVPDMIRFIRGSQAFSLLMMDYRADRKVRDFSGENLIGSVISSYHKMWLQLQLKLPQIFQSKNTMSPFHPEMLANHKSILRLLTSTIPSYPGKTATSYLRTVLTTNLALSKIKEKYKGALIDLDTTNANH